MKRIGIVTFYNAYNYGAFFQQYALQKFLTQQGFEADIMNYTSQFINENSVHSMNVFFKKGFRKKVDFIYKFLFKKKNSVKILKWHKKFSACIKKELKVSEPFTYDRKDYFNEQYDFFIAGSDQVWNTALTGGDDFYFLDFANPAKKRTYAVSFGFEGWQYGQAEIYAEKLKDFSYVTVREKSGRELMRTLGIQADVVLDPSLLIERGQWSDFSEKSSIKLPEKYIMLYIVQAQTDLGSLALEYAKENDCEIILVSAGNRDMSLNGETVKASVNITPYDFINYLLHAQAVFTTSFHGMILSLYLQKNFYYELMKKTENRNTRLENIAELFEISHREIKGRILPEKPIDWDKVNKRTEELREYSKNKLLSSLN